MKKKLLAILFAALLGLISAFPAMADEHLAEQGQYQNIEEAISVIRGMYRQTNQGTYTVKGNQTICETEDGSLVIRTVAATGNELLDPIMREYGYQTYSLEFYYNNPDYNSGSMRDLFGLNFIYAVIDGREYRYYFRDNSMIRRIGPDGRISDNPKTNEFLNLLYQAGCYYQAEQSVFSSDKNLNEEVVVFLNSYYVLQDHIRIQASNLEGLRGGKELINGTYVIDANTRISEKIQSERTWKRGDNGYTWMKRFVETDPVDGGYFAGLECLCISTTDGHVDEIEGIYATH